MYRFICVRSGLRANFDKASTAWIWVQRFSREQYHTNQQLYWNHEGNAELLHVGIIYYLEKVELTENYITEMI